MKKYFLRFGLGHKLVRHFLVYLGSGSLSRAVPFLVLLAITNFLSREDFGRISIYFVMVQLFAAVIGMKLMTTFQAEFFQRDDEGRRHLSINLLFLQVLISLVLILLTFVFRDFIQSKVFLSYGWILSAVLLAAAMNIFQMRSTILRLQENPRGFAVFQIIDSILNASFVIAFVILFRLGWEGRIYAAFVAGTIMLGISLWYLIRQRWLAGKLSVVTVVGQFRLGAPLLPQAATPFLRKGIDRIILTAHAGLALNGVYSFASAFGSVLHMVMEAFFATAIPNLYKSLAGSKSGLDLELKKRKRLVRNTYLLILGLTGMLVVSYFVLSAVIIFLFSEPYHEAVFYIPFVLLEVFFQSLSKYFSSFLIYAKKTLVLGSMIFSVGIFHAGLSLVLIPSFGIYGAFYSLIVAEVVKFVITVTMVHRCLPLPWFSRLQLDFKS